LHWKLEAHQRGEIVINQSKIGEQTFLLELKGLDRIRYIINSMSKQVNANEVPALFFFFEIKKKSLFKKNKTKFFFRFF
jgi:hypothetical protein